MTMMIFLTQSSPAQLKQYSPPPRTRRRLNERPSSDRLCHSPIWTASASTGDGSPSSHSYYFREDDSDCMSLSSCDGPSSLSSSSVSSSGRSPRRSSTSSRGTAFLGRMSRSFTFDRASLRLSPSKSYSQSLSRKKVKKRVRFDLDKSTCQIVARFENRHELWYHPRDLALGQAYHYRLSRHPSAQEYLRGSAMLFDHVVRNAPLDYRLVSSSISFGLEDGYRGLERWTDTGKVRRLRAKAIVKKIVESQIFLGDGDGDTIGLFDLPEYAGSLTKSCHAWAEMTGRLDAINAS